MSKTAQKKKQLSVGLAWIFLAIGGYYFLSTCQEFPFRGNPIAWLQAREPYAAAERERNRYDDANAVTSYKKAIEIYPYDHRFYLGLSESLSRLRQYSDAEKALQTAATFDHSPEIWLALANVELNRHDLEQAETCVQRVLQISPRNADAIAMLALIYQLRGKTAEAEKVFAKAEKENKDSARYWILAGKYYAAKDNKESAEGCFKHATAMKSTNVEYMETLAYFYSNIGKNKDAQSWFQKALAINDKSILSWESLGELYLAEAKLEEAEEAFTKAASLAPNNVVLWRLLGQVQFQQNKFAESERTFKRVLELAPQDTMAADFVAMSLYKEKKFDDVEAFLRKATSIPRQSMRVRTWYCLGELLERRGSMSEAKDAYEKALTFAQTPSERKIIEKKVSTLPTRGKS